MFVGLVILQWNRFVPGNDVNGHANLAKIISINKSGAENILDTPVYEADNFCNKKRQV